VFADTILNLVWAALCVAAFAWLFVYERRRSSACRAVVYRSLALGIALVSLFPCVSASDDWVRLQFLSTASHQGNSKESTGDQPDQKSLATLVRMLEALDSVQVGVTLALAVVLCLFALAVVETYRSLDRFLPARAGRAPPFSIPV
jgi:hypothetical protein